MKKLVKKEAHVTPKRFRLERDKLVLPSLKKVRTFDLQVTLHPYNDVVLDVLNSMENDRLMVLDEREEGALDKAMNGCGPINLRAIATIPVSIRRWLAVGCQVIRWDIGDEIGEKERKGGAMAMYRTNAAQVIFRPGICHELPGPTAFVGEIIVNAGFFSGMDSEDMKRLPFVIAHELTHVFDSLRMLVPALKNWRKFWCNVMEEGRRCEDAAVFDKVQAAFVDDYGSENELATVREYWPSKAQEWFEALRGKQPK